MSGPKNIVSLNDEEMSNLFHAIWQFRESGSILRQPYKMQNGFTKSLYIPNMTIKAFECELEMKYIILKKKGHVEKIHDLKALFNSLPDKIKNECFEMCNNESEFVDLLEEYKNAFETFRYENNFKGIGSFQPWFLDKLSDILYKYVK